MGSESSVLLPGLTIETRYNRVWDYYFQVIDWRYKFMTRISAGWAGLIVLSVWLKNNDLWQFAVVCLVGVGMSVAACLMEKRTVAIVTDCEREGFELEKLANAPGLFTRLISDEGKPPAYDWIMPRLYFGVGLLWLLAAIMFFAVWLFRPAELEKKPAVTSTAGAIRSTDIDS